MKPKYLIIIICITTLFSCKKEWLDVKPNKSLVVPQTIKDYQALLDNSSAVFNTGQPALGEIASDDYYVLYSTWQSLIVTQRKGYNWTEDGTYQNGIVNDWNQPYAQIVHANIILKGIENIVPSGNEVQAWNNVKGSALFYRAFAFYNLAQLFAEAFTPATATSDLGIPLKLSSDINERIVRTSVQQTYNQIIQDLMKASSLLSLHPLYKTRPSLPAAYALLARTYLTMQQYDKALVYADTSLNLYNQLMDYNSDPYINPTATNSMSLFNPEVIFHSECLNYGIFASSRLIVDSLLYKSYSTGDLRKSLFFVLRNGQIRFKGNYTNTVILFGGLATDELYLVRAECYARIGNKDAAMNDLNTLLIKRWKTGLFVPFNALDAEDALQKILTERRKELCFRTLRWSDLRRLNQDPRFTKSISRVLDNQTYTLLPNDLRYTMLIPLQEIQLSGIEQNRR